MGKIGPVPEDNPTRIIYVRAEDIETLIERDHGALVIASGGSRDVADSPVEIHSQMLNEEARIAALNRTPTYIDRSPR